MTTYAERMDDLGNRFSELDQLLRYAAMFALIEARETELDRWPTPPIVSRIARKWGVPVTDLAAFFGFLIYPCSGRMVWADTLRRGPGWQEAPAYVTRENSEAYDWHCRSIGTYAHRSGKDD